MSARLIPVAASLTRTVPGRMGSAATVEKVVAGAASHDVVAITADHVIIDSRADQFELHCEPLVPWCVAAVGFAAGTRMGLSLLDSTKLIGGVRIELCLLETKIVVKFSEKERDHTRVIAPAPIMNWTRSAGT